MDCSIELKKLKSGNSLVLTSVSSTVYIEPTNTSDFICKSWYRPFSSNIKMLYGEDEVQDFINNLKENGFN